MPDGETWLHKTEALRESAKEWGAVNIAIIINTARIKMAFNYYNGDEVEYFEAHATVGGPTDSHMLGAVETIRYKLIQLYGKKKQEKNPDQ